MFIYCLLKASHADYKQIVGLQVVELKPGQFIFGRKKAADELKMKESTIWKYMKLLEKVTTISLKSNNKFTVVTVEKWEDYQSLDDEKEQQSNSKRTSKEQQSNTNKNLKNLEEEEEEERPINQNQISPYEQIVNKFIQRRNSGLTISTDDEMAIERILKDQIPLDKVLVWIDEIYDQYQPKHRLDTIKKFTYLEHGILDRWAQENKPKANEKKPKKEEHTGRAVPDDLPCDLNEGEDW